MTTQIAHNIADVFANLNGNSFVGLDTEVVPTLKGGKSNPMKGRVTKRTKGSRVQVFQNKNGSAYGAMVHRRLAQQLQRQAAERAAEAKEILAKDLTEEQVEQLAGSIDAFLEQADNIGKAKGLFTLSPRKWGERIEGTPFIQHTKAGDIDPKFYLEVIFINGGESEYFLDGNPIAKDQIIGLQETETKEGANVQGGLEAASQVIVRTYEVSSLTAIRAGGKDYQGKFFYA
jgi:hypothetical protein